MESVANAFHLIPNAFLSDLPVKIFSFVSEDFKVTCSSVKMEIMFELESSTSRFSMTKNVLLS